LPQLFYFKFAGIVENSTMQDSQTELDNCTNLELGEHECCMYAHGFGGSESHWHTTSSFSEIMCVHDLMSMRRQLHLARLASSTQLLFRVGILKSSGGD
jgi:hypothetical protein